MEAHLVSLHVEQTGGHQVMEVSAMAINPIQFQRGMSLPEFMERYGSEAQCEATLQEARPGIGKQSPVCGGG